MGETFSSVATRFNETVFPGDAWFGDHRAALNFFARDGYDPPARRSFRKEASIEKVRAQVEETRSRLGTPGLDPFRPATF